MACDGCTPLRAAAEHPNSKSVRTLLDFGADANARSMSETPLHLTARCADPEALEIPLQAGADIYAAFAMYPRTEDELMNVTAPARGGGERGLRGKTASRARRGERPRDGGTSGGARRRREKRRGPNADWIRPGNRPSMTAAPGRRRRGTVSADVAARAVDLVALRGKREGDGI